LKGAPARLADSEVDALVTFSGHPARRPLIPVRAPPRDGTPDG
jgi:hypothetical protein